MKNEEKIIQVKNISFSYPDSDRKILDDCSFFVRPGEILSILGPNGAGKSTLLHCLCNIIQPQQGEILLYDEPVCRKTSREIAGMIGYVQQSYTPAFAYTVLDYVMMGAAAAVHFFDAPKDRERERALDALSSMKLSHLANKRITELSGGEFQQVTIARVLVQDPKIIIFDEPTAHLDYGKQILTLQFIHQMLQKGYSVIMTTHNPDHVLLLGGQAAVLDPEGSLRFGPVSSMITEEGLKGLYQIPLKLAHVKEVSRTACILPNLI